MKAKTITREELYNLVWSKPVSHIARGYGVSDNWTRKVCEKHNIPLPKPGYWSKLKFNKEVVKTKLPKQEENPKISFENTKAIFNKITELNQELKLEQKEIRELEFNVPKKLSKPQKYIKATKKYQEKLKIRNKKRDWRMQIDSTNVLSINVSEKLLPRALRFMDILIKIIEKRGYNISTDNGTTIIIKDQSYKIRLTEKNKRVKRETNYSWNETDLVPTGNLSLKLYHSYLIKEWSDSKTKNLEGKLIDILVWLEIRAKKDKEREIENEIWRRNQEKIRLKQEELQRLKDKELGGFESLFLTATRWHKSQYIRNYLKEFEDYAIKTNTMTGEKKQWIDWAKKKADWYDPFIEREVKLLEDICRDTLKQVGRKYY
jgi:hypothetical protein